MIQKLKFTCFKGILKIHLFFSLFIAKIKATKRRCNPCTLFLKKLIWKQPVTVGGFKHYLKASYYGFGCLSPHLKVNLWFLPAKRPTGAHKLANIAFYQSWINRPCINFNDNWGWQWTWAKPLQVEPPHPKSSPHLLTPLLGLCSTTVNTCQYFYLWPYGWRGCPFKFSSLWLLPS